MRTNEKNMNQRIKAVDGFVESSSSFFPPVRFVLLWCMTAIVLCAVPNAHAQLFPALGGQRAGTAAVQFLKIGVGARSAAMAEAFTAVANDGTALFWNPAGLMQSDRNEVLFSHLEWLVDVQHEFFGYVHHLGKLQAIGLSFISLHTAEMQETTEYQPFGTGRYFSYGDIALGLTYSRQMTDKFSFGLTVKYVEETIAELKMRGALLDIGTYYHTGFGSSRFGVSVSNFGGQLTPSGSFTRRDGTKVSSFQSFTPPTIFRFGLATEIINNEQNRLTMAMQLNHPNDNSENLNFGGEYWWRQTVALRAGYKLNVEEQSYTLGSGFNLRYADFGLRLDYAFADFGRLGNINQFSVALTF